MGPLLRLLQATGYIHEDTFSFTELTPEGPSTKNGKYLSWECGPANGTYTAIVEYTTTAPDGTGASRCVVFVVSCLL